MRPLRSLLLALTCVALLALPAAPSGAAGDIEDYPSYQPATRCTPKAKPGAVELGRWLQDEYGGGSVSISRACGGSTSEHTEGRAVDWSLDARVKADPLALRVKLADIASNTDRARMALLDEATRVRLTEKYRKALEALN